MKNSRLALLACVSLFCCILLAQDAAPITNTASFAPAVESSSDYIGGLRSYGPVHINDVTGKTMVTLPSIGPSELLSVRPRVRSQLKFDPPSPPVGSFLYDQFDALGAGGSIGWGHFWVIDPGDEPLPGNHMMTYYQDGAGSGEFFYRDYLYQDHRPDGGDQFSFQNTIDDRLRRMTWQGTDPLDPYKGDYLLLEPSGRRITFKARKHTTLNTLQKEWLFYPTRIEDPDGEWVEITYHETAGIQSAMMKHMKDNHGRSLRFIYNTENNFKYLNEIRLLAPGEDPETAMGVSLATFTYASNGLINGSYPPKSLQSVTDAEGYEWKMTWQTSPSPFLLASVENPKHGKYKLQWEFTPIKVGDIDANSQVTTWRVTKVTMTDNGRDKIYTYQWAGENSGRPRHVNDILKVTVTGPEGLVQVTRYENMPVVILGDIGYYAVYYPTSGHRFSRETTFRGTTMKEEWVQEAVYLWATTFQPPHSSLLGAASGDAIHWAVRPAKYNLLKDGRWYDTTYTYGFYNDNDNPVTTPPDASILEPISTEMTLRGQNVRYKQTTEYENRVEYGLSCFDYPANEPYALNLLTSEEERYTFASGVEQILSKKTNEFGLADVPFPTLSKSWATASSYVATHFEYYPDGSNKGKLSRTWVGDNPSFGTQFLAYNFGIPSQVQAPNTPVSFAQIDFKGNILSLNEKGVPVSFTYDNINRLKSVSKPTMAIQNIAYSTPASAVTFMTKSYGNSARKWTRLDTDGWDRPIKEMQLIVPGLIATSEKFYNNLNHETTSTSSKGSTRTQTFDVFDRLTAVSVSLEGGSLLESRTLQYESFATGNERITETSTRSQGSDVEQTERDLAGRIVETSYNKSRPGTGGTLTSDDYAGGGHTKLQHDQNQNSWLVTTTISPYGVAGTYPRQEVRDLLGRVVSVKDPEYGGGTIDYTYDSRGLLYDATFPDGRKWRHYYDNAGRLTEVRQRTSTNPDIFGLRVQAASYNPTYGFIESQTKKLEGGNTRVQIEHTQADAMGRPAKLANTIDKPTFWRADISRETARRSNQEEIWNLKWRPISASSGIEVEYVVELKPLDSNRISLYFPQIRRANIENPWVEWTLDNAKVSHAITTQLTNHPDRQAWLSDAQIGLDERTVLNPARQYRLRVTAIDANPQASYASYWWGDLADLMVDDIDIQLAGQTIALDFRVFNAGTRRALPSLTKVFLSPTPTIPTNAQPVMTFQTPAIEPGFAQFHSILDLVYTGNAYVFILVDTEKDNTELSENNNTASEFLAYQGQSTSAKPDVVVEAMDYAFVAVGQRYETYATYSIRNQNSQLATSQDGQNSLGNSLTRLYYSADNIISNDDQLLATPECPPLAPLAREIQTTSLGVFNQAVPLHSTHLVANANSGIDEEPRFDEGTNRYNNVATIELPQLEGFGPDLVVSHFVHQGLTGSPGNLRMNLSFTLRNLGVWQSRPSHVGFYYSADAVFGAGDVRLNLTNGKNKVPVDRILPGWNNPVEGTVDLVIPNQSGYIIVVADVDNEVVEANEQNWRSQSFLGYADLVIQNATYNSTTKRYSMTVRNIGNLASTATDVRSYVDFTDQFDPTSAFFVSTHFSIPALAPGQATATLTTVSNWVPPTSNLNTYLFFVVDVTDTIHERDENNNVTTPFLINGTGQGNAKPDLVPDQWGFTHDYWAAGPPLVAPDFEVSHSRVQYPYFYSKIRYNLGLVPPNWAVEVRFSGDNVFGNADDEVLPMDGWPLTGDSGSYGISYTGHYPSSIAHKKNIRFRLTSDIPESSATNNTEYTTADLPYVMACHSVTNQTSVGCGPSTVAVFMSRDFETTVSPSDVLVGLYLDTGFAFAGSHSGPMIDYNTQFMNDFSPLNGWYMKFVVDALNVIDEADETNNVLVVNPDFSAYQGSSMPRGLPPMPRPGAGTRIGYRESNASQTGVTTAQYREMETGLYRVNFRMFNNSSKSIALKNLSVFASTDMTLTANAKLISSSLLVGDSQGNMSFPASIPAYGSTSSTEYLLRVPKEFRSAPFKLIFVANAKKVEGTDLSRPLLFFDNKDTLIIGVLDFENQSAGR